MQKMAIGSYGKRGFIVDSKKTAEIICYECASEKEREQCDIIGLDYADTVTIAYNCERCSKII